MIPGRAWLAWVALIAACTTRGDDGAGDRGRAPAPKRLDQADSLYTAGEFANARAIWQVELAEALEAADSVTAARLLTSIGLAGRNLGEYPESRQAGEEALALKQRLGMTGDLFRSYNALGLLAWDEGRLDEAAARFDEARLAAEAVGDRLGVAKAAANMAQVHYDRGEIQLAREGFLLLRDVSREVGDTVSLGRALLNLGMVDLRLGDPLAAIAAVAEARRLAGAAGDAEAEENALGQMATAYSALGQPGKAFAAIDSALAIAESHGLQRRQAEDLKLLGDYYAAAGDHRRALVHYRRAQGLNVALRLPEDEGNTLRNEAWSYRALGHPDTARARAERALAIHRAGGFAVAEFDDHLLLAELASDQGDDRRAAASLLEAHLSARAMGTPVPLARAAVGSARAHDRAGRPAAVLAALDSADGGLVLLAEEERWQPDALRARAYARLGRQDEAELAGRRATGIIERIRAGHGSAAMRTSYLAERAGVFADLVLVLLTSGKTEAAFEVADAARGRALLEHLGAARRDIARGNASATALLQSELLLRRIEDLTAQLRTLSEAPPNQRGTSEVARTRSVEDRLAEARSEYEAVIGRLQAMPPGAAALAGAASVSTADIRRSLRPDELLVEYLVAPDRIHLFALDAGGLRHVSVTVGADQLASRVRLARELTARPETPDASAPVLAELYRLLIAPLEEAGSFATARRLVLVPHGPLAYLPFAALRNGQGEPLILRHALLVLPSAGALPALRSRPPAAAGGQMVAVAPLPGALPASRPEVEDVRRAVGGRILLGRRATEPAVREALEGATLVHIATHGVMNPANPMFTRLEVAPGATGRLEDDGRLEVHELLGLRMAAELVYLSGCETGKGAAWRTGFEQGEDYLTLSQAFMYAGVRNVVATLWRVDDPAAAAFAGEFYRAYGTGAGPVEALASAQRAMLRQPGYRPPYYWAAYQVSGSGEPARGDRREFAGELPRDR